ncbi:MAG: hypothetical protein J7K40_03800 [candidate division Zixibacteria bacterium]|nr:hypothetical protein [candidate division Zixibacteria bacterium]
MRKIIFLIIIIFMLGASKANAVNLNITFEPDDTLEIAEGTLDSVTVRFVEHTGGPSDPHPPVSIVDPPSFISTSITWDFDAGDPRTNVIIRANPGYSDAGSCSIDITASDLNADDTTVTLTVIINNSNRAPVIENLPTTIDINEGDNTVFAVAATDLDGDIDNYSMTPSIDWVSINTSTGAITVSAVPDSVADWNNDTVLRVFNVTVEDLANDTDTENFTVRVQNVNRPPVFQKPSQDTVVATYQADTSSIIFYATDEDTQYESDDVSYSNLDDIVTELGNAGWYVSIDDLNDSLKLTVSPPHDFEGLYGASFRFAAYDLAFDTTLVRISFIVVDNIPPDTITSLSGSVSGMAFGKVELEWDAPHEDMNISSSGAVNAYYIKYATSAPANSNDWNWWNSTAEYITQNPPYPPATPGNTDNVIIDGLTEYQNYWFGIMARDAANETSIVYINTDSIKAKSQAPEIAIAELDSVLPETEFTIKCAVSDSGGTIDSISFSFDSLTWADIAAVDSVSDSSASFIRKHFHIDTTISSNSTLYVKAYDSQVWGYASRLIYIDNTPPAVPIVTDSTDGTLVNDPLFYFAGTKETGATVWAFVKFGGNPGSSIRLTEEGDNSTTWQDTISAYYQGQISFRFYATDEAGNPSDSTSEHIYTLDTEAPYIVGSPIVTQYTNEQQTSSAVMNILFNEALDSNTVGRDDFTIVNQDTVLTIDSLTELVFLQYSVRIDFSDSLTTALLELISQSTGNYPVLSIDSASFTDMAGNYNNDISITFQSNLNVIDDTTIVFTNSTNINPDSASFTIEFTTSQISYFTFSILNEQGNIVYSIIENPLSAGDHSYTWVDTIDGSPAPDGWYKARFSARPYPVSPYDLPIEVVLILDSYAPYEASFFPNSGSDSNSARVINSLPRFELVVGDTGAVSANARAEIVNPFLVYGDSDADTLFFSENDSIPNLWLTDSLAAPLTVGLYEMTLVIADSAGNLSSYAKYYEVTDDSGVAGFLNYPNPFAPSIEQTAIVYNLGGDITELKLEIYDTSGDLVYLTDLTGDYLTEGSHEIPWNGKSSWGKTLNNGVYFARLTGSINSEFLKIAIADR